MNREETHWESLAIDEVAKRMGVDLDLGLSGADARKRLLQYGGNKKAIRSDRIRDILINQVKSPFIYLLFGVAAISFILEGASEALVILGIVVVNALLGFYQEYMARRELQKLGRYLHGSVVVLRDGSKKTIKDTDIVVGDIVILSPGNVVHADVRIIQSEGLLVDEAVLTGESSPEFKRITVERDISSTGTTMHGTMAFAGTTVMSGYGKGIVVATGSKTMLGGIEHLALETNKLSSFMKDIDHISQFVMASVVISLIIGCIAQLLVKGGTTIDFVQLGLVACALGVSIIPTALPLVMTFALSQGARDLAKKKVIVKRLASIEDLGNMDILCTDKTGTLTENSLIFCDVYDASEKSSLFYGALPTLLTSGEKMFGGFDKACCNGLDQEARAQVTQYRLVDTKAYDPAKHFASYSVEHDAGVEAVIQGSPEDIIKKCQISDQEAIQSWLVRHNTRGSRLVALASKLFVHGVTPSFDDFDTQFNFLGLIAFDDPIRTGAEDALTSIKTMGVQIKILSGDRKEVCGTVAHSLGLIDNFQHVMTGKQFAHLSDEDKIAALQQHTVFAGLYPQQKHEIIGLLQKSSVVGYLGDGINDAPALRKAHVGITVEGATDIARGEADIILLAKSLNVIVEGIVDGRRIFANSAKYLRITLSSNFSNFYAVLLASLMLDFLPMLPVQILLANFLTDLPMMAVSTDVVDRAEVERPRHYTTTNLLMYVGIVGSLCALVNTLFFSLVQGFGATILQTSWFTSSCINDMVATYALRTDRFSFFGSRPSSPVLLLSLCTVVVALLLPMTWYGAKLFGFTQLALYQLILIVCIAVLYFFANELGKYCIAKIKGRFGKA